MVVVYLYEEEGGQIRGCGDSYVHMGMDWGMDWVIESTAA